jgi:hypothetical protein
MWTLLLVGMLGAALPDVEVQTLGGEMLGGPLVELSDQKVTVRTATGQVSLEIDKLVALAPKNKPKAELTPAVWLDLVDGSRLAGQDYVVKDNQARVTTAGGVLEIPTRNIASVRLQPETEALAAQWTRIREGTVDADLIVVRKEQSLDYHRGVLHDVTAEVVQFDLDREILPVKRPKVYGILYRHPAGRELPQPRCELTDAAGSHWAVRTIALEGDKLRWTTPAGVSAAETLASIARIDFSEGKIIYLSDLKPESLTWTPFFGNAEKLPALAEFFAPRQDRALEPRPLKVGGKEYTKGLALHSRTELVYRLPRPFRRLQTTVGIDDRVRPGGHVHLVIRGDDRVLADETVAGTDPPKPLDLDLTGVRRVTILVDFGKDMDVADHLDLCEARVLK